MEKENEEEKKDAVKALEDKLDQYIIDFVNLNAKNKTVLKEKFDALEALSNDKILIFEEKLKQHIEDLQNNNDNEEKVLKQFQKELEIYAQQLHDEFEKGEKKRLIDKNTDINLIMSLKKDNSEIKKKLLI